MDYGHYGSAVGNDSDNLDRIATALEKLVKFKEIELIDKKLIPNPEKAKKTKLRGGIGR